MNDLENELVGIGVDDDNNIMISVGHPITHAQKLAIESIFGEVKVNLDAAQEKKL